MYSLIKTMRVDELGHLLPWSISSKCTWRWLEHVLWMEDIYINIYKYIIIYMIIYITNIKSIQTSNSCGKKNNVCGSFVQVGTVLVRVGVSRNPFAIHQGRRKNQWCQVLTENGGTRTLDDYIKHMNSWHSSWVFTLSGYIVDSLIVVQTSSKPIN